MKKMSLSIETITASKAQRLLATNTPANRRINWNKVKLWSREIQNGTFQTTHQGIAIGWDGKMYDGQHRLLAIIEAAKVDPELTITIVVARNVDPATFPVIDSGVTRTLQGFLEGPYKSSRSALSRTILALEMNGGRWTPTVGSNNGAKFTTQEVLDFIEANPDLDLYGQTFAKDAQRLRKAFPGVQTGALLTGGYIAGLKDQTKWDQWWRDCDAAANATGLGSTNPVRALFRCAPLAGSSTNVIAYSRAIYAGAKYADGKPLRTIMSDKCREFQAW